MSTSNEDTSSSDVKSRFQRVYYGWWVAIAGAFNMMLSSGPTFQAASVLFKAMEDEFGWSRALISGVASFGRFGGALLGPVEGWMTDRFGSGKMVLLGFIIGGAGLILFSRINGPIQYYAAFFILSLGFSIGGFTPSITAVNAWMTKRRATAMSLVIGGSSISGLLVPPIVWGIDSYGWRDTVMVIGIITILAGPLIALVMNRKPPQEQEQEESDEYDDSSPRRVVMPRSYDFTPREALRTRSFWAISMTHLCTNLSVGAISAHLFLHLSDSNGVGLDSSSASTVIPVMVVVAFTSQIMGGVIGDIANKRVIVPFLTLLQGASLVILAFATSLIPALIFAVAWGIGFGARTPMLHAMRGEYFGRRHFGTILGMSSFPMAMGMMASPVIVGRVHDIQHTYRYSLFALAAFCVLAAIIILFATRPMPPALRRRMDARRSREMWRDRA